VSRHLSIFYFFMYLLGMAVDTHTKLSGYVLVTTFLLISVEAAENDGRVL